MRLLPMTTCASTRWRKARFRLNTRRSEQTGCGRRLKACGSLFVVLQFAASACLSEASSGKASATGSTGLATGGSASTTGGAGVNCVSGVASAAFDGCADAGRCGCPLECVDDPLSYVLSKDGSSTVCESPCQSNADCVDSGTACTGGTCKLVACGGTSGNGLFNSTCSMGDQPNDGTCDFAPTPDGGRTALCFQAGLSDGGCNPDQGLRSMLNVTCIAGFICFNSGLGNGCMQLCDNVAVFCPAGQICAIFLGLEPPEGVCESRL